MEIHRLTDDVTVMSDCAEIPGLGFLPVNAFVLHAQEPVVVDTGLSTPDKDFLADLARVIDPADVRWIWLTHPDRDHTGGLWQLMEAAPHARLITTFLGVGIMSCQWEVPMDRVFLLNPGQSLDVGDRLLTAFRPPLFDNPATVGFQEDATGVVFSSDCFGGPMNSAELATCGNLQDVPDEDRRAAQLLWAAVDSPWVVEVDRQRYEPTVEHVPRPQRLRDPQHPPATRSRHERRHDHQPARSTGHHRVRRPRPSRSRDTARDLRTRLTKVG